MWATQQERYHLDGLYHPFMVILGIVYYSVHDIIPGDLIVILWLENGLAMVNNGMIWDLAFGKLTVCYWKWPFIVDLPIKMVISIVMLVCQRIWDRMLGLSHWLNMGLLVVAVMVVYTTIKPVELCRLLMGFNQQLYIVVFMVV